MSDTCYLLTHCKIPTQESYKSILLDCKCMDIKEYVKTTLPIHSRTYLSELLPSPYSNMNL